MKSAVILRGVLTAVLLGSVVLAACARATPTPAPTPIPAAPTPTPVAKPIAWRFASIFLSGSYWYEGEKTFAERINQRSGGRLVITYHPASVLSKGPDILRLLKAGDVEIAQMVDQFVVGDEPILGVSALPFMLSRYEELTPIYKAVHPFWKRAIEQRWNSKYLGAWPASTMHFWAKKPLRTPEDFKGVKIRVQSPYYAQLLAAAGAVGITMPYADLYTALQQGIVDGMTTSFQSNRDMKGWELLKYGIVAYFASAFILYAVNNNAWAALPADLQQIVVEEFDRMSEEMLRLLPIEEAKLRKEAEDHGMKMIDLPQETRAWLEALSVPVWDTWLEKAGAEGAVAVDAALKALGRK